MKMLGREGGGEAHNNGGISKGHRSQMKEFLLIKAGKF